MFQFADISLGNIHFPGKFNLPDACFHPGQGNGILDKIGRIKRLVNIDSVGEPLTLPGRQALKLPFGFPSNDNLVANG